MFHKKRCETYDARVELGYPVIIKNGVIEYQDGSIEIPAVANLSATVAVARALLPLQLCGSELKFLRKALQLTGQQFSDAIDAGGAAVVSRWESDKTAMGGYLEKVIRQLVVDDLRDQVPNIDIPGAAISRMKIHAREDGEKRPFPVTVIYKVLDGDQSAGQYATAA